MRAIAKEQRAADQLKLGTADALRDLEEEARKLKRKAKKVCGVDMSCVGKVADA